MVGRASRLSASSGGRISFPPSPAVAGPPPIRPSIPALGATARLDRPHSSNNQYTSWRKEMTARTLRRCATGAGALALVAFAMGLAPTAASAAPRCTTLATDPAIKSATSAIVAAAGANVSYCKVSLLYGTTPNQNINIVVGLPLSAADGGSGGVQGAWNGRTQGLGGGGCAGNLSVTAAVNTGYVGSGTDGGHSGGDCTPGVN